MADSSNNGWARRPRGVVRVFGRKPAAQDSPAAKRRPIRGTLIALAALLPVVSVLAVAAPATAHTQNMDVTSVCQNDGSYLVTYTLNYDKGVQPGQAYKRTGTTLFSNGWSPSTFNDWTSLGTLTSGSGSLQWTETLPGTTTTAPWEYTYIKWSDNIVTQGDDRPENLTGNCGTAHPALTAPKITQPTCDNPQGSFTTPKSTETVTYSSNGNVVTATTQAPYTFSATQGWTITNSGHTATYTVTYTTLENCPAPLTPPVITQPTCESQQGSFTKPADTANVVYTVDGNVVTATTQAPFKFSATAGWVISQDRRSATYTVTYTTLDKCPAPLTPPVITQPTCENPQGSFTTPTSTATVTYTANGNVVTATTQAPYRFSATAGWVISQDRRSATYTVTYATLDVCPAPLTPPVITQPTCASQQGSFTTPTSTATVTYTANGNVVTATTQAPYKFSPTTGWVIGEGGRTATYTVTYTTLDNCPAPLTPPVITQPTCASQQGSFTKPVDSANVTYAVAGNVVTATTHAPYKFSATTGWVIGEGGRTATYTVTYTTLDNCPAPLTAPTVTQPTCTSPQGSFTTPSSTTTVVYTATGSTITATTKAPYTFSASTGWVIASGGRSATYTVTYTAPANCPVEQAPVLAPKPAITKTVNVGNDATVAVGDQLTFTVTLSNTGNAPATGDVVDTLPANVDPVPGSFTKDEAAFAPASITADTITWTGVTVAAGQTVTLVYKVTVLDAAAGTTLVNKATWQGLSASTTDSVSVGEIPSTGGGLAHTGAPFNPWSYLVWATMFLALGVIFLVFGRRDDEQED